QVLRRLKRELPGLDLELVAACGLSKIAGGHQRVTEIDWRRRRRCRRRVGTGGKRQCATQKNSQFPHRALPCPDYCGRVTCKEPRGSYGYFRCLSGVEVRDLGC